MSDKILGYRFHGLHGRVIPLAAGAKIANPKLTVIALGGDGASFSEGIGHLVHGIRSNYDITFILHNNANYGLTTGQASALTPRGQRMNSSPDGIPEHPLNSMDFVFSLEPTFVARGFNGAIEQLTTILKAAIEHRGFSYVDVLQACPTYNRFATHEYLLERCFDVAEEGYDSTDAHRARALAVDTTGRIATGVLYRQSAIPTFMHQLASRGDVETTLVEEVDLRDVASLCSVFQ
jgi:2-oxoglutarate ferredoxin oxidoreductase subunit beta